MSAKRRFSCECAKSGSTHRNLIDRIYREPAEADMGYTPPRPRWSGRLRPRGTLNWRLRAAAGPNEKAVRHDKNDHGQQHEERADPEECAVVHALPEGSDGLAAGHVRAAVVLEDAFGVVHGTRPCPRGTPRQTPASGRSRR